MQPENSARPWMPRFMSIGHRYAHAPIVEAIIDFRCTLPPEVDLDRLARLPEGDNDYTSAEPQIEVTASVGMRDGEVSGTTEARRVGHLFRRTDGQRAVQSALDHFAFSWLPPYDRWDSFVAETEQWWLRYRALAAPLAIHRIGVRYINQIDIPAPTVEIGDYLRTNPQLSPVMPQLLGSFLMQCVLPLPDHSAMCRLTTTFGTPTRPDTSSLILDIDVWRELSIDLSTSVAPDEEIISILTDLHDAKNFVFEASITDATRGLIN